MKRKNLFYFGFFVILFIVITVVFVSINSSNQQTNSSISNYAAVPTQMTITINTPVSTTTRNFTTVTSETTKNAFISSTTTPTPAVNYSLSPKIGLVSLDTQKDDILKLLGEPKLQTIVHGNGSPEWDYQNGLTLYLGNFNKKYSGDIWRIIITSPYNGATTEGLRLGDSKETFYQIYSKFGIGFPQGNTLQIKSSNDVTLYVEFDKDSKVSSIALGRE